MRNKIFIGVFCGFLLLILIGAPLRKILTDAGVVPKENVGNVIEVEKVYEEGTFGASLFNGIEGLKRDLKDIYTNYFPYYVGIKTAAGNFTVWLNAPVSSFLTKTGNQILLDRRKSSESSANSPGQPATEEPATEPPQTEPSTEEPATQPPQTEPLTQEPATEPPQTEPPTQEPATEPPQTESPTQEPATQPPQTEPPTQEPATEPPQTTEELQTEPVTEEIPAVEPTYEVIYLSGDRSHRYYEIKAQRGHNGQLMDFLVRIPAWDNSALRPDMEAQLEKINRFAASKPEVNWYVFPVTCFEDTALCDEILPSESKRELFVEFRNRLNPGIQYDCVEIKTIEDKYNKYFRTDHHWNVYGYTEAYRKITAMMQKNYSDIKLYEPEIRTFDEVEFYGSNALAVSSYNLSDTFAVAVYPLADHTVVREKHVPYGGTETLKESLARYESGNYEKSKSYSHYIQFQMICRKIEYPENKTGRNLLIIGDSYSPPLQEVLASYFDTTYVRYVDSNSGLDPIAYEYLIEKYNITDVLLLEMSDRVVYDYYGDSLKGLT